MADFVRIGRASVRRGKSFELRCRGLMALITPHTLWRRTQAGREQTFGDLVPTTASGVYPPWFSRTPVYVECKYRKAVSATLTQKLIDQTITKADGRPWCLILGQPNNPVVVTYSKDFPTSSKFDGEVRGRPLYIVRSNCDV